MNISIDPATGTVTMPVADFLELAGRALTADAALDKLFAVAVRPGLPCVHVYHVRSYTQVRVVDGPGPYWVCSCNDFRYRRQAPDHEAPSLNGSCKHLGQARADDALRNAAAMRA